MIHLQRWNGQAVVRQSRRGLQPRRAGWAKAARWERASSENPDGSPSPLAALARARLQTSPTLAHSPLPVGLLAAARVITFARSETANHLQRLAQARGPAGARQPGKLAADED